MKDTRTSLERDDKEQISIPVSRLKMYFIRPISVGLFAFSIFFTVILVTKIIMYVLSEGASFNLNIYDIIFSVIGFTIGFLIEFLLQLRRTFLK